MDVVHRNGAFVAIKSTISVQNAIAVQINAPQLVLKTSAVRNFRRNL
jgi:hypothetical protein